MSILFILISSQSQKYERINLGALIAECVAEMVPLLEEHELSIRMEETDPVYAKSG